MSENNTKSSKAGWIAGISAIAALLAALGVNQFFPKLVDQWLTKPSHELRYDGFYKEQEAVDTDEATDYLRFYPDGRVINSSVVSSASAGEVVNWFNKNHQWAGKGTYVKTPEGTIEFVVKHLTGEVAYQGQVAGNTLNFHVKSRINQHESDKTYQFMETPSAN